MIPCEIPGYGRFQFHTLVLDFNGTLAQDGALLPQVAAQLNALADQLDVVVVTADTFGSAQQALADVRCRLSVLPPGDQDAAKQALVLELGAAHCVAVGNGRNDRLMLETAALGIVVVQGEGAAVSTLLAADVVCPDIHAALGLLLQPRRLQATLRA